jgi:hypothetical protein
MVSGGRASSACGASIALPRHVLSLAPPESFALVSVAIVLGRAAAYAGNVVVGSILFGLSPVDSIMWGAVR